MSMTQLVCAISSSLGLSRRVVIAFCVLMTPASATAATYYVSVSGNDNNAGTSSQPLRTVANGVSRLHAGDTLLVGPGTYAETLFANIPSGTSWSSPVTLRAWDPANRPILRPGDGAARVLHFQGQQYIIVDGFVLDGINVGYDVVKITTGSGQPAAHHIRIMNSELKNAPAQCVLTTDGAGHNEFIDNDIHDCGVNDFTHGMYISTSDNLIDGNRVYRNTGWGVHVYGGPCDNNVVRNNVIHDNASLGQRGDGIILSSGSGNVAYNNVIYRNNAGIVLWGDSNAAYNNTVVGNRSSGIGIGVSGGSASSSTLRNNIVYDNGTNYTNQGSGTAADHNIIGVNPLFVNEAADDYRLRTGSPAIDGGVAISGLTLDINGAPRLQGSAVDIGAFEFGSGSSTPQAPTSVRIVTH